MILSEKTEKDEISSEILEEKTKGGPDLINEGNKLVNRLDKLNEIPVKLFKQSLDESKLSFNELLIKSLENNFFQLHLPNIWSDPNIDSLFNEVMELTEELQSKNDLLSISVECHDKKSSPIFGEPPKSPNSIESLIKSPKKNNQKHHERPNRKTSGCSSPANQRSCRPSRATNNDIVWGSTFQPHRINTHIEKNCSDA